METDIFYKLHLGLQFKDAYYAAAFLAVAIPSVVAHLFFTFTGNAKMYRYLSVALTSCVMTIYFVLSIMVGTGQMAELGISFAFAALALAFYLNFWFTELFAFPSMAVWSSILLSFKVAILISALSPWAFGFLHLFPPSVLLASPSTLYMIHLFCVLFLAFSILAISDLFFSSNNSNWSHNLDFQTSFVSAWIVVSGTSFIVCAVGLATTSPFDAASYFTLPTAFRFSNFYHLALLATWLLLTTLGTRYQTARSAASKSRKIAHEPPEAPFHEGDLGRSDSSTDKGLKISTKKKSLL